MGQGFRSHPSEMYKKKTPAEAPEARAFWIHSCYVHNRLYHGSSSHCKVLLWIRVWATHSLHQPQEAIRDGALGITLGDPRIDRNSKDYWINHKYVSWHWKCCKGLSSFLSVCLGVRQCCILAPTLFSFCMEWILGKTTVQSHCRATLGPSGEQNLGPSKSSSSYRCSCSNWYPITKSFSSLTSWLIYWWTCWKNSCNCCWL